MPQLTVDALRKLLDGVPGELLVDPSQDDDTINLNYPPRDDRPEVTWGWIEWRTGKRHCVINGKVLSWGEGGMTQ